MQSFIAQLNRLYLADGALAPGTVEQRLLGHARAPLSLATPAGLTRAIVIDFRKQPEAAGGAHWTLLCSVANALQTEYGLPAPAVSISGDDGFNLWLSLEKPAPIEQAQAFLDLLRDACMPGIEIRPAGTPVELPPCLHERSGRWAAFINPGLGASFAEESGLDMAPPLAGQVALLEGLHSVSEAQFAHAIDILRQSRSTPAATAAPAASASPAASAPSAGLLLADATIEDIVRHLHARNIEPTFRYLIR